MAFLFAKLYFLGLGISAAFRKGFFLFGKDSWCHRNHRGKSQDLWWNVTFELFHGEDKSLWFKFKWFLESFKNICDVMEIRVEGVSFMIELRHIFWYFWFGLFFGPNFTGKISVVLLTKLLQRVFLSYLKYKIKIIERISI